MAKIKRSDGSVFLTYFGPLLDALRALGGSGTPDEVVEKIALDLHLSDEVQNQLVPSGASRLKTNVAFARFYLYREGLLDSSKRGIWSLTEKGRNTRLTIAQAGEIFRKWVEVFNEQRRPKAMTTDLMSKQEDEAASAEAVDYRAEVLDVMRKLSPSGFERLSQRLLREAGFSQVEVTGRSNDGGIDGYGTLQINPMVSFKVLFQSKRYTKAVSSKQVRDFRGAMDGRADKGIFLTTGSFTAEARREAARYGGGAIELIDSEKLISMLESLEVGLKPTTTYEVDKSFFEEFRD